MQDGREQEDGYGSLTSAPAAAAERREDVPAHELVDGFIPGAPVDAYAGAIPPVCVELAVAEAGDLGQGVQEALEEGEEAGEPDDEGDGGEFHEALEDGDEVERGHFVEGVAQDGRGVLRAREPDEDGEPEDFGEPLGDEGPADAGGAGVDGLVDEGGRPPEVGEVREGDVLGVGTLGVDVGEHVFDARGRMEIGVSEVAVREGVGRRLEPDDYGVYFGEGADERMVDVIVDDDGGYSQA